MLRSRISRRVLSEQHIALTAQYHDLHEHGPISDGSRYIGIIDTRLCPFHTIKAIEVLLPLITGVHTELIVEGNKGVTIAFIDAHLKYVVLELVKNAVLAATKARRAEDAKKIYITIADSPKFLGVRVSDLCACPTFPSLLVIIPAENQGFPAGGIAADRDMPMDLDGRPLHQASRSSLLSFSHPRQLAYIPVLRDSTRLAATIEEQVNTEANERLGLPGQRKELAMSLGLCKVYAEVNEPYIYIVGRQAEGMFIVLWWQSSALHDGRTWIRCIFTHPEDGCARSDYVIIGSMVCSNPLQSSRWPR